jgi:eukaryotic-like serine/threonine-protein kinase
VEGIIAERFAVETRAGVGGMGTVYRAIDRSTNRRVALKMVRQRQPEDADRFLRESEVLATLVHPRIVRHVAHGRTQDGLLYLAMEWVEGVTLQERLANQGLTVGDTLEMAARLAEGLAEIHARGLVHRDVKPSNIIFRGGDLAAAVVIDFGLARPVAPVGNLTQTGAIVGTPNYMAPEQVRGERHLGPRVDVFGLGCVMYECLTGRLAFEGHRFLALKAKILLWNPCPPSDLAPDVRPELDDLVLSMLAKDPEARPRDGAEVASRLAALRAAGSAGEARPRRRTDPPTWVRHEGPPETVAVVVATTIEATDVTAAPTMSHDDVGVLRSALEGTVRDFGVSLDVLQDGSVVATLEGPADAQALARRAAGCALAIRDAYPKMIIGLSAGEGRDRILEEVVQGLARDAMAMLFAASTNVPSDAVWIDSATATLLGPDYEVVHVKQTCYLRGSRA